MEFPFSKHFFLVLFIIFLISCQGRQNAEDSNLVISDLKFQVVKPEITNSYCLSTYKLYDVIKKTLFISDSTIIASQDIRIDRNLENEQIADLVISLDYEFDTIDVKNIITPPGGIGGPSNWDLKDSQDHEIWYTENIKRGHLMIGAYSYTFFNENNNHGFEFSADLNHEKYKVLFELNLQNLEMTAGTEEGILKLEKLDLNINLE